MGTVCKLFDDDGRMISDPVPVTATVSWRTIDGIAQAFGDDGRMLAELRGARVEWIEAGGIRIAGMEPVNQAAMQFRIQAWPYKL